MAVHANVSIDVDLKITFVARLINIDIARVRKRIIGSASEDVVNPKIIKTTIPPINMYLMISLKTLSNKAFACSVIPNNEKEFGAYF